MFVIGITGGIASGKSIVAEHLQQLGAVALDADRIGHDVLRVPEVQAELQQRWGDAIFTIPPGSSTPEVNRPEVARRVFAPPPEGPRELEFLESVTHPRISARIQQCLDRWQQQNDIPAVVLDAPVLYKAGWDAFCDLILFVEAPEPVRLQRAAQRGWTAQQLLARQAQQPDLDFQRQNADVVIDNGGTEEETWRQLDTFWATLCGPEPPGRVPKSRRRDS